MCTESDDFLFANAIEFHYNHVLLLQKHLLIKYCSIIPLYQVVKLVSCWSSIACK